uniref:Uncharacterized protein n=1 Tax=Anopheles atroparvus TaxID=41427 RepID=A0AAG5DJ75_ANOAO
MCPTTTNPFEESPTLESRRTEKTHINSVERRPSLISAPISILQCEQVSIVARGGSLHLLTRRVAVGENSSIFSQFVLALAAEVACSMSTGYKHLYSCLTFLIFVFVFNFYKNRIGVGREREVSLRTTSKLKRTGALNLPPPIDETGEEFLFGFSSLERHLAVDEHASAEDAYGGWLWDRLKQYPGRCLDVEVFFLPPSPPRTTFDVPVSPGRRFRSGQVGLHYRILRGARGKELYDSPEETNSSIYVFLSVLVILILAAGVDIAKHLTAARTPPEHAQRRLSLQNYQALIREKQKQFRMMKQHCSQPSMSIQRSMDEPTVYPQPFPYGGGRGGEDTPGGMHHPAPLVRRQSVPTLRRGPPGPGQAAAPAGGRNGGPGPAAPFGRRTSVDSFWDTNDLHLAKGAVSSCGPANGSSPEVRRRVRMLHRH